MDASEAYDVAVVGAGAAGLQAALTLGRMRQRVVVLGTDRYRNDPAREMHNFLGHDGTPPAALRAAARADIAHYPTVTLLDGAVLRADQVDEVYGLELAGAGTVYARRVLLATGVVDQLPDVPGVDALWGNLVAHCPFCHGYEFSGTPVGILGSAPYVAHMASMVEPIASRVVVFTNGDEVEDETMETLARSGHEVRGQKVLGLRRGPQGLTVALDGGQEDLGGLFVKPVWRQASPLAERLGADMSPMGAVLVDAMGRTSRKGLYAAGDMAQGPGLPMPMASVLTAASGGMLAAAACVQDAALDRTERRAQPEMVSAMTTTFER